MKQHILERKRGKKEDGRDRSRCKGGRKPEIVYSWEGNIERR